MFDRTAFWSGSFEDARKRTSGADLSYQDRFQAAWEMTCLAFHIDPNNPPPMDRTAFSMRKRPD